MVTFSFFLFLIIKGEMGKKNKSHFLSQLTELFTIKKELLLLLKNNYK